MAMEIFTVGRGHEGYPERLMPFADMPSRLFVRGALPADEQKTAAIVGARICTAYGKSQAAFFAQVLAANGVAVISGLACGIDAAAHEGALRGKGKTFAVLGCGVDICYPKQNYPLMRRMLENGGGVLSEFPPGAEPLPWHFPIRNRVISALADVVLVIEAKEKSGSLITADYALEQGKNGIFCSSATVGSVAETRTPERHGFFKFAVCPYSGCFVLPVVRYNSQLVRNFRHVFQLFQLQFCNVAAVPVLFYLFCG